MIKVLKNSKYYILFCLLMVTSLTYSQGSRYAGTYTKSAPIVLANKSNIVIEGLELEYIDLRNCQNITIKNCKLGPTAKKAIYLYNSTNITVVDCSFDKVQTGLLASTSSNIKFDHNDVKNIQGETGNESTQMVQFIYVNGTGNSVSYNVSENIPGQSSIEDHISMFGSNGTPESPIMISGNWIRGGGPSTTGGGINLGDSGGSYIIAENNILVNPGGYGIGISGGKNLTLRNNKIYSKKLPFSGVGMVIWDWWGWKGTNSYPLSNITAENNELNWTNKDGFINTSHIDESQGSIKGLNTNKHNSSLNESILPAVIIGRAVPAAPPVVTPPVVDTPTNTNTNTTFEVYVDSFNRISVKCLANSLPPSTAEIYTSKGVKIGAQNLKIFRTLMSNKLAPGQYIINVSFGKPIKTESTKIIIK